jgi:hypothetical protein
MHFQYPRTQQKGPWSDIIKSNLQISSPPSILIGFQPPGVVKRIPLLTFYICKCTCSIPKVTLSLGLLSPPIPLFHWYLQSKEILSNFNMKCWKQHFNAQGSSGITHSSCTGRSSENICRRLGIRKDRMKLNLSPRYPFFKSSYLFRYPFFRVLFMWDKLNPLLVLSSHLGMPGAS